MPTVFPSSPSNGDTYIPPQIQKLLASDAATSDYFGYKVAISSDGNTAIVGAFNNGNSGNGSAYVFTRSGSTWTQQQELSASDAVIYDGFGRSVALSSDGNTAIIGAYLEDTTATDQGAAYVFTRSGSVWTQQQKLLASDPVIEDEFGFSVALSSDGNTALIGAPLEDTSPNSGNGAAYVFTRTSGTWTEQQKLTASDAAGSDDFGVSVALSSDGDTAIIGADGENTSPNTDNGAAYVFTRSGGTWTEQQKLLASDAASGDFFGGSVSLSSDGDTAIIGASSESTTPNTSNGAAYVFTRTSGTWTQQQKLTASDRASNDFFGSSVAISADGDTAIIGTPNESTSPYTTQGTAYIFTRSGVTWTQKQKLLPSDIASNDQFGGSVSISSDGSTIIIGAYLENTTFSDQGAVYTYNFNNIGTEYSYNSTQSRWEVVTSTNVKKAPTTHLFTSSVASWTIPTGARIVHAVCIGGGGGGGGGGDDTPGGAGGGGGGLSTFTYNLVTGYKTTAVITVGAGGAGGSGGGTNSLAQYVLGTAGATGGTSSFKLADSGNAGTLSAFGGGGGGTAPSSASTSATSGGSGGFGMWVGSAGGAGGSGTTSGTNAGVSATSATLETSPGGGGGGGGTFNLTNTGDGGAGASALTLGTAVGTAISKTDANITTLGVNSVYNFVNTYYPAKTPPAVVSSGGGGNGAPSGGYMVTPSGALGYYGGTGGLYGGGGGGGGTTPSGSGDEAFGGNGGAGAQGCVFITVWYE